MKFYSTHFQRHHRRIEIFHHFSLDLPIEIAERFILLIFLRSLLLRIGHMSIGFTFFKRQNHSYKFFAFLKKYRLTNYSGGLTPIRLIVPTIIPLHAKTFSRDTHDKLISYIDILSARLSFDGPQNWPWNYFIGPYLAVHKMIMSLFQISISVKFFYDEEDFHFMCCYNHSSIANINLFCSLDFISSLHNNETFTDWINAFTTKSYLKNDS